MSDVLQLTRAALSHRRAWLVGGAVRDRALGREVPDDLDVVIDGDPSEAARALTQVARDAGRQVACFALSREFGGWRVVARDGWQVDLEPLRGGSLEADLLLRDFTVNAIAEPIVGGVTIDPLGGMEDLAVRRLRAAGPAAFIEDPLRVLRLVRIALELGFTSERTTVKLACATAGELRAVAPERVFAELARILDCREAVRGLALLSEIGAMAAVLPEIEALKGVEQSRYHHLDVHGHTIEVLERVIELQESPGAIAGAVEGCGSTMRPGAIASDAESRMPGSFDASTRQMSVALSELLAEPLADGLTRGSALRWGALLHDIAKPATRELRADGRVTFIGHDVEGTQLAGAIMKRLRTSERLSAHVCALVRHHLRLGFLVHEQQPLAPRTVFSYLDATEPVGVDVTLLSIADRLATRGDRSSEAIDTHLSLAHSMLTHALRWRAEGAPRPLLRGDQLASELGIERGPLLGRLMRALSEAQYAGEVSTAEQAIAYARTQLAHALEAPSQATKAPSQATKAPS